MICDKVSVVMPVYNAESTIVDAINSVLCQTYSYLELIIVDDASDDGSLRLLHNIADRDKRVKIISLKENVGAAHARNEGIRMSSGEFLAFIDADDLWKPNKISTQLQDFNCSSVDIVCHWYDVINQYGAHQGTHKTSKIINHARLLRSNCVGCSTVMYRVSSLGKRYFPDIRKRQDYALWLLLSRESDIICTQSSLSVYRKQPGSISSNKLEMIKWNYMMFRNVMKFSQIQSIYRVSMNIIYKVFSLF